jgi:hypothetical protein
VKLSRSVTFVVVTGNLRMPESRLLRRVDAEERDERERTAVKRVEIMAPVKEWVGTRTKTFNIIIRKQMWGEGTRAGWKKRLRTKKSSIPICAIIEKPDAIWAARPYRRT